MSFFTERELTKHARGDASVDLDAVEDRITATLGSRPRFDPAGNHEHARLAADFDKVRVEELRGDIARAEDATLGRVTPPLLTIGLVFAFIVEAIGAVLITKALGLPPNERLPLGLGLAGALLAATMATARRAARLGASAPLPNDGSPPPAAPRSIGTLVVLASYALFVGAIAVIRLLGAGGADDDVPQVQLVAEAVVMLATALGPAWIAEAIVRHRAPAAYVHGRLRALRRRAKELEARRKRAQATIERIARAGERWDRQAARLRALYRATHAHATATRASASSAPESTSRIQASTAPGRSKT